ncbi:branched-chain amino acid aminotransferase [Alistipes sp. OttesenSCG-928-B03]|nr:branched-chain amino acid aminotransferase [Alistipes sp. OttesenSCG-928-B03]
METIDWGNLGFGYTKTDFNIRCVFRDGKWQEPYMTDDETLNLHMAATCLHYGQEAFEGLKAFRGKDGFIRLFRGEDNARRMQSSAEYLKMAVPPVELFMEMTRKVVAANERFVPPYGTGASLYIRPLIIGSSAQIGVKPAEETMLIIFVMPVGPYFKEGFNPIRTMIDRHHDRAAARGTGHVKSGGNYGASIFSLDNAHKAGYPNVLFLDPKEHKYVDEFGAANFFGIKDKKYITPDSHSVLPSITNMSLRTLAEDLGLTVENRKIEVEELATLEEAGAVGTAAVISPIGSVYDPDNNINYIFGDGKTAGEWSKMLYQTLQGIQYGEIEDTHNWCEILK